MFTDMSLVPRAFPSCAGAQTSCLNTTAVADLCCFNAPGGQLLQTQFWDTAPATGPVDSWTVHGLWPDHCDGTYDANCDAGRVYTNISGILSAAGKTDLLAYMNLYWKDYQGNDESFWEHEWSKHGTCISTLEPSCYGPSYVAQQEVVDYFQKTVDLFKGLDSYKTLAAADILPSTTTTYTLASIKAALAESFGVEVIVQCSSGALTEIWYGYHVRGSVQAGSFIPTGPDGSKDSCPSTGIKYLPKTTSTTTPKPTVTSGAPASTATAASFSGSGFLNAFPATSATKVGCLISAGTWYVSGTCATYTAVTSGTGFKLSSSKGPCGIVASTNAFSCAAGVTQTVFTAAGGYLAYTDADGLVTTAFSAKATPTGSVQEVVSAAAGSVGVKFAWQAV